MKKWHFDALLFQRKVPAYLKVPAALKKQLQYVGGNYFLMSLGGQTWRRLTFGMKLRLRLHHNVPLLFHVRQCVVLTILHKERYVLWTETRLLALEFTS